MFNSTAGWRLGTLVLLLALTATVPLGVGTESRALKHKALLQPTNLDVAAAAGIREAYGRVPLSFESNSGQTDSQAEFIARGAGFTLFLSQGSAVLVLRAGGRHDKELERETVLRIDHIGGSGEPQVIAQQELPGKVNYFIGNDPGSWRTNIATYARVKYRDVYPGVDLVYYGNDGQLEYDFVVAPGADPASIGLGFAGANDTQVDAAGDLVLHAGGGDARLRRPVLYQEANGVREAIAGGYVLYDDRHVGFAVGAYDPARPLVIDPVLVYSTYLGGSGFDEGLGIAVDPSGHAYVTGVTTSANFPTVNAFQPTFGGGGGDAFVTKLSPDGAALVYSTYLGGGGTDGGLGIAVDPAGHAFVTGVTQSANFPTVNAFQPTFGSGFVHAFVTKLSADGAALVYSTYLGGSVIDRGFGIAVDPAGHAFVTGVTKSANFPTVNAFQPTRGGDFDAFVTKLSADGAALVYSTYLGGGVFDEGLGIAVDPAGHAFVTGVTESANFPTVNAYQPTLGGGGDAFVTKLSADGAALVYSTYLGGGSTDEGLGIAADPAGHAYVTGFTASANFPTVNAFQPTRGGDFDAFVTKVSADGAALVYSTYLGGGLFDEGFGIAADPAGHAYVTGFTASANFPTVNALQLTFGCCGDAFVTKLSADGAALVYSTYLGGGSGSGIAVDIAGDAFVTGTISAANFPTTAGAFDTTFNGVFDAFVAKISRQ